MGAIARVSTTVADDVAKSLVHGVNQTEAIRHGLPTYVAGTRVDSSLRRKEPRTLLHLSQRRTTKGHPWILVVTSRESTGQGGNPQAEISHCACNTSERRELTGGSPGFDIPRVISTEVSICKPLLGHILETEPR